MSDITRLYVEKHGTPALGTRIFIRTRQYLDGGHDQFHEVNAVVPEPQNRIDSAQKALTPTELLQNSYRTPTEHLRELLRPTRLVLRMPSLPPPDHHQPHPQPRRPPDSPIHQFTQSLIVVMSSRLNGSPLPTLAATLVPQADYAGQ